MAQRFAMLIGLAFVVLGLLGFTVTGVPTTLDVLGAPTSMLFGVFPTNVVDNVFYVLVGLWGMLAGRSLTATANYGTIGGVLFLVLAASGYFYPDTFGYLPNGGYDVWLHAGAALLLLMLAIAATARRNALEHGYAVGAAHAQTRVPTAIPARDEPLRLTVRPSRDDFSE